MAATGNSLLKSPGTSWEAYWLLCTSPRCYINPHGTWQTTPFLSCSFLISQMMGLHDGPSRCPPAYFINLPMNVPSSRHVPRLCCHPREDMEMSLDAMWGTAVPWHKLNVLLGWRAGGDVCQPNEMGSAVHGNSQDSGDVGSFFVGFYT